jgi:hypothetical protein
MSKNKSNRIIVDKIDVIRKINEQRMITGPFVPGIESRD